MFAPLLAMLLTSPSLRAQERTVAKAQVAAEPGKPPVEVWVTRQRDEEGGVVIKLVAKGVGPKPQALTLYTGGGADDGAGDAEVRKIAASPFDLPGGRKGVRVDFTYRIPDGRKKDEQTDTSLVGFGGGKAHKLIELRTRLARDRSKLCREAEEIALSLEGDQLIAIVGRKALPELGDDDLPIDKTCKAPRDLFKRRYPWKDEHFVDAEAEAAEAAAAKAAADKAAEKAAAKEEESDD